MIVFLLTAAQSGTFSEEASLEKMEKGCPTLLKMYQRHVWNLPEQIISKADYDMAAAKVR
jgi:hypothetical protein